MENEMKLSVLMPVYDRESASYLRQSLDSLAAQTLRADEVVLVEDGPLGEELAAVIAAYAAYLPLVPLRLPVHAGLGIALRAGLNACRGEFVARMDSDDICVPNRFQKQLAFLESHPEVDVVGGAIAEFGANCPAANSVRRLPVTNRALLRFASFRNPLNHMTVVFRRASVQAAGSYRPCPGFEDYHLWVRMLALGCRLHNMDEVLVYARCGNGMQNRRGGLAYFKQEMAFQFFLHKMGMLRASGCLRNVLVRAPIRLAPAFIRSFCYGLFLRDSIPSAGERNLE
jgi:glycosyltransferase involved in cell wall biosynthesis